MKEKQIAVALYLIGSLVLLAMEANSARLPVPPIPDSIGMAKDYIDILNIVIFPWHGWTIILPAVYCLYKKQSLTVIITATLLSAFVCGAGDSAISFNSTKIEFILKGTLHYLFVFSFATAATIATYKIIQLAVTATHRGNN
ncbi:hypothetical protein [Metapseudomonas otitidis]|uniref:hypothetical protein n=1 Tax=Metapseudomonas otitidis TaxID=319939 RepID=UPI0013F5EFB6|nr:hypothetical protein [Pseudomonas otitidis]